MQAAERFQTLLLRDVHGEPPVGEQRGVWGEPRLLQRCDSALRERIERVQVRADERDERAGARYGGEAPLVFWQRLRPDDGGEQIERAIRFLQRHFREKITLADVAMATGMEPESFRRFFRRTVRVNVTDYLLELRLGYAEKLLQDTAGSISAIALEAGFRNLSNFNRLFRARRGITPRAYRNFSS